MPIPAKLTETTKQHFNILKNLDLLNYLFICNQDLKLISSDSIILINDINNPKKKLSSVFNRVI